MRIARATGNRDEITVTVCDRCMPVLANGDDSHLDAEEAEQVGALLAMLEEPAIGGPISGYGTCWGCDEDVIDPTEVTALVRA